MNLGYLEFITQWPLLLAAVISFFAIKSFLFKGKDSGIIFDQFSEEMVTNTIKDSLREKQRDMRNRILLEKASHVSEAMYIVRGGSIKNITKKSADISLDLNNWQKAAFAWALVWFGITIFFIVETFLDPANWGNNWSLLPYFIYYIIIGIIYVFKR